MLKSALAFLTRLSARPDRISDGRNAGHEPDPIVHATWYRFDNGKTVGQRGSERGVIVLDEEHAAGARITLEREARSAPFAITCGVYGTLVHTRFFKEEGDARRDYKLMKDGLARIAAIPFANEERAFFRAIEDFMAQFP